MLYIYSCYYDNSFCFIRNMEIKNIYRNIVEEDVLFKICGKNIFFLCFKKCRMLEI